MMLVERANKDFYKWCVNPENKATNEYLFKMCESGMLMFYESYWNKMPFEMRYGYYITWFCSVGIPIGVVPEYHEHTGEHLGFYPVVRDTIFWKANHTGYYEDLNEARVKLIEEAMNIYNKELSWKEFKEQRGL